MVEKAEQIVHDDFYVVRRRIPSAPAESTTDATDVCAARPPQFTQTQAPSPWLSTPHYIALDSVLPDLWATTKNPLPDLDSSGKVRHVKVG
jgi:hypothetical protein